MAERGQLSERARTAGRARSAGTGVGWWGVGTLIASEAALFSYLLFSYYYTGATARPGWLLEPRPKLAARAAQHAAAAGLERARRGGASAGPRARRRARHCSDSALAFLMGTVSRWCSARVARQAFRFGTSSYASLYFVTTGFHMAHVLVGLLVLLRDLRVDGARLLQPATPRCRFRRACCTGTSSMSVWLFVFTTYYLTPYLGFGR